MFFSPCFQSVSLHGVFFVFWNVTAWFDKLSFWSPTWYLDRKFYWQTVRDGPSPPLTFALQPLILKKMNPHPSIILLPLKLPFVLPCCNPVRDQREEDAGVKMHGTGGDENPSINIGSGCLTFVCWRTDLLDRDPWTFLRVAPPLLLSGHSPFSKIIRKSMCLSHLIILFVITRLSWYHVIDRAYSWFRWTLVCGRP